MRSIHQVIDSQLKRWEMDQRVKQESADKAPLRTQEVRPWITISREVGSLGEEIAQQLAGDLGFQVFDREIVEAMAENSDFRLATLEMLDEKTHSGVALYVEGMIRGRLADGSDYTRNLMQVLVGIAHHGRAILLGRGAAFLLEPGGGLNVRIVAPAEIRVSHLAGAMSVSNQEARRILRQTDRDREDWVRKHLGRDVTDPQGYDLVLNTAGLSVPACAGIIRQALEIKMGDRPAGPPSA